MGFTVVCMASVETWLGVCVWWCVCVCGGGRGGAEMEDMKTKNVGQWFVKHLWNRKKLGSAKKIAGSRNASQINLGKVVLTAPPTAGGQPAAREYRQKTRNSEEVCLDLQWICQYFVLCIYGETWMKIHACTESNGFNRTKPSKKKRIRFGHTAPTKKVLIWWPSLHRVRSTLQ